MGSEEVRSPPYPGEGSTTDLLYANLQGLRSWVLHYRTALNEEVGEQTIPAVKKLPDKKAYVFQPVMTQYQHLMLLRRIREEWDHLVRSYEDAWDCPPCVRRRAMLVQSAAVLLNGAFVPYEVREAHQQKDLERMQRSFERLTELLRKVMDHDDNEPEEVQG